MNIFFECQLSFSAISTYMTNESIFLIKIKTFLLARNMSFINFVSHFKLSWVFFFQQNDSMIKSRRQRDITCNFIFSDHKVFFGSDQILCYVWYELTFFLERRCLDWYHQFGRYVEKIEDRYLEIHAFLHDISSVNHIMSFSKKKPTMSIIAVFFSTLVLVVHDLLLTIRRLQLVNENIFEKLYVTSQFNLASPWWLTIYLITDA